jgi:hypothetical protein
MTFSEKDTPAACPYDLLILLYLRDLNPRVIHPTILPTNKPMTIERQMSLCMSRTKNKTMEAIKNAPL